MSREAALSPAGSNPLPDPELLRPRPQDRGRAPAPHHGVTFGARRLLGGAREASAAPELRKSSGLGEREEAPGTPPAWQDPPGTPGRAAPSCRCPGIAGGAGGTQDRPVPVPGPRCAPGMRETRTPTSRLPTLRRPGAPVLLRAASQRRCRRAGGGGRGSPEEDAFDDLPGVGRRLLPLRLGRRRRRLPATGAAVTRHLRARNGELGTANRARATPPAAAPPARPRPARTCPGPGAGPAAAAAATSVPGAAIFLRRRSRRSRETGGGAGHVTAGRGLGGAGRGGARTAPPPARPLSCRPRPPWGRDVPRRGANGGGARAGFPGPPRGGDVSGRSQWRRGPRGDFQLRRGLGLRRRRRAGGTGHRAAPAAAPGPAGHGAAAR